MPYRPKIITGIVKDTGLPIDGHELYFAMWDYDRDRWHLYGWEDEHDEAVMLTMYQTEKEAGLGTCDTLEAFTEKWKAKQWEPDGVFSLELNKVEVLEVKQEEEKNDTREKLIAGGFKLTPRKRTDKGGILCMPLDKNLNGDVQAKHPDWEPVNCPGCGLKCWKPPIPGKMHEDKDMQYLCTECAINAGFVAPYNPEKQTPPAGPNRAQRRKASLAEKRAAKYRAAKKKDQYIQNRKKAEELLKKHKQKEGGENV